MRPRVIPALLLQNGELIKTIGFKKPNYIGDPINTLKLFNDLEVDEVVIFDIGRSKSGEDPDLETLEKMATECFIPLCYGGGIKDLETMSKLYRVGIEKLCINSAALDSLDFVRQAVKRFGAQSVVIVVDIKKNLLGKYKVYDHRTQKTTNLDLKNYLKEVNEIPVGEIIINAVDQDGEMTGYDLKLARLASKCIQSVPLIVCGGAGKLSDVQVAIQTGVDAAAAGSLFIYQNKERGVLVNYPSQSELDKLFSEGKNA